MLDSAIGYTLTFFMAFAVIPVIAFLLRMLIIMTLSKLYWNVSKEKAPGAVLKFSIKIAQPVGFFTAIFHGYAAVWMGVKLLKGFDVQIDLFLPGILAFCFIWFGIRRLQKPAEITINGEDNTDASSSMIVLNPEVESIPENGDEDSPFNMNEQLKNQLKDKTKDFMNGNTIVNLIGRLTGLALAAMSYIGVAL